ncbi:MAG TPA: sulfatase-like hydrolase/transferase [Planctomycetota bacterium]|nr:sulfatase-like hydrolase/transferase [Planctomycetota bacterium]
MSRGEGAAAARAAGGAVLGAALLAKVLSLWVVPVASVPAALRLGLDDLALALGLATVLAPAPRWLARAVAVLMVAFLAANVVLERALGVPMLRSMWVGVDPAMADSAWLYVSPANAGLVLAVLLAAACGARLGARVHCPAATSALACLACIGLLAVLPAPAHVVHRNAAVALVRSLLPRAAPAPPVGAGEPVLVAAATASPLEAWRGVARGRSVVFVVLESAAARFVDGDGPTAMPYLASLAHAGLDCRTAYAVYPESIEGQVPIFCALPPKPDGEPTDYGEHARLALPHRLASHGYTSALFHAGRFRFLGMQHVLAPMGFDVLADAGTIGGEAESSFGIDEEATVDALLRWVGSLPAERPFLACYLPIAGHHPYASPEGGPCPTDTPLGCYENALHYADRALRRLWSGVCALRPADRLLLCVVGDHGEAFGEHAGNFGHSFELYEENLRVPLVFHAPGTAMTGLVTDAVCSHLDVVPTLLDLLGLPVADSLLRRPLHGGRAQAFTDWGELLVMARDGDLKLVREVASGREHLFDLSADPGERQDLAPSRPEAAACLRGQALRFLAATGRAPAR